MKKITIIILLLLSGCSQNLGVKLTSIQQEIQDKPHLKLKTTEDKILESKEVAWIEQQDKKFVDKGKVIAYDYISNEETNENIIFKDGEVYSNVKRLTENGNEKTDAFYSGDHFYKEGDKIFKIKHGATTTIEAFAEQTKLTFWDKVKNQFAAKAADIYSGAGDGAVNKNGTSWADAHDATIGTAANPTAPQTYANYLTKQFPSGDGRNIFRGFFPFDTSSICSAATISAATMSNYWNASYNDMADGNNYAAVVQTSQADSTTLSTEDYDAIANTEGSDRITFNTSAGLRTYTLDATGRGWIKKIGETSNCGSTTGVTCLGTKTGHDIANTDPAGQYDSGPNVNFSEQGDSTVPYLTVTHDDSNCVTATPVANEDIIIFE